jgi:hypothetical protein
MGTGFVAMREHPASFSSFASVSITLVVSLFISVSSNQKWISSSSHTEWLVRPNSRSSPLILQLNKFYFPRLPFFAGISCTLSSPANEHLRPLSPRIVQHFSAGKPSQISDQVPLGRQNQAVITPLPVQPLRTCFCGSSAPTDLRWTRVGLRFNFAYFNAHASTSSKMPCSLSKSRKSLP